ncbi:MAG: hypothetical protein MJK14_02830 [Rivularia sp. ALOHA_DT_140]|nr:hypothetical protein [Rivularia sp. ALOHA_DT_140]
MKFSIASLISVAFACTVAITASLTAFAGEKNTQQPLNYVGVGASNRGAAFESKLSLNERFSVRPTATTKLFEEGDRHATIYVPITYDFGQTSGGLRPFVGGGAGMTTDGRQFGGVLTTGADYRINKRLTAVGSVNLGLFEDNRDFTAVLGIATNFNR